MPEDYLAAPLLTRGEGLPFLRAARFQRSGVCASSGVAPQLLGAALPGFRTGVTSFSVNRLVSFLAPSFASSPAPLFATFTAFLTAFLTAPFTAVRLVCLLAITLALQPVPTLQAAEDWELRKEEGGIRVLTRPQPDSDFAAVRAEMLLENVSLAALTALIEDPEACSLLESRCAEARVLERRNEQEMLLYRHNDMPFPIKDRDMVLRVTTAQDPETLQVVITLQTEDGVLPDNPRRVRLPSAESAWIFTPRGEGRVEVVSEGHIDPGASLPAWMLNRFLVDAPFATMQAVAKAATSEPYISAVRSGISEPQ